MANFERSLSPNVNEIDDTIDAMESQFTPTAESRAMIGATAFEVLASEYASANGDNGNEEEKKEKTERRETTTLGNWTGPDIYDD